MFGKGAVTGMVMGSLAGGNGCKGTEYATCLVGSSSASLLHYTVWLESNKTT